MPMHFTTPMAALLCAFITGLMPMTVAPVFSQSSTSLDRFVGTWREDESKAQLGSPTALVFRRGAGGQLEELRGGQVNPQVQAVEFDGKPRVVDPNGRTIAWTQQDWNTFKRVSSDKSGRVFLTRTLRLSPDGRTLTEEQLWSAPEARKEVILFEREQGKTGLEGTWRMRSYKSDPAYVFRFERAGATGLRVTSANGAVESVTLTGEPVAVTGPNVISGSMVATKLLDDGSIEATTTRNGEPINRVIYSVSADGRTMIHTVTGLGKSATGKPSVYVFVKQ